jgi:uncharacterized protein YciI
MIPAIMTLALLAPSLGIGLPKHADKEVKAPFIWLFFMAGERKREYQKEELEKMQADHVGNLGTLYNAGKCSMAGPTGDANPIRGIVFLNARTEDELKEDFKPDPFVQGGLLKVHTFPVESVKGLLAPAIEPFEIEQNMIVFLKAAPGKSATDFPKKAIGGHRAYLDTVRKSGKLPFFASSTTAHEYLGILILPLKKAEEVKEIADQDPLVKGGWLVWEAHPQWLGKGTLRN